MTTVAARKNKVGDLRPSQLLYAFGVGALLDLPNLSALVMGLDDWETGYGLIHLPDVPKIERERLSMR